MNRKERRARGNEPSPLGGYGAQARKLIPGYITPGAPCDACGKPGIGDSRTLSWLQAGGKRFSVLVRTCREHTACPINELMPLLPMLPSLDGVGYMRMDSGAR